MAKSRRSSSRGKHKTSYKGRPRPMATKMGVTRNGRRTH